MGGVEILGLATAGWATTAGIAVTGAGGGADAGGELFSATPRERARAKATTSIRAVNGHRMEARLRDRPACGAGSSSPTKIGANAPPVPRCAIASLPSRGSDDVERAADSMRRSMRPDGSAVDAVRALGVCARCSAESENRTLCSCRWPVRGVAIDGAGSAESAGPSDPSATTIAPHFLQRIFTIRPRTFSSAILYRAWHV
jgi:hypothetical protein